MKRKTIKNLMLLAIAGFTLHSCMEDLDLSNITKEFTVDQSLVVPLGESNLTLAQILAQIEEESIQTEGTEIFVNFEDTLIWDFRKIDLLTNSTPMTQVFDLSPFILTPILPNAQFVVPYANGLAPLNINSDPADMRIDEVVVRKASLMVEIEKTDLVIDPANIRVDIQFAPTDLKFANNQTVVSHTPTAFGVEQPIAVSNFTMFTPNNATSLPLQVRFVITNGSVPVVLLPTSSITIKVRLAEVEYLVSYGHFNPAANLTGITEQATFDIDDVIPSGMIKPANPQMFITALSNVGIDLDLKIDYIKALRAGDNSFTPVSAMFPVSGGPDSPTLTTRIAPAQLGFWQPTVLPVINSSYGKIDKLFDQDKFPNTFEYKFSIENVSDPSLKQFITPDAKIKIQYRLKVPLHAKATSYYELNDTIKEIGSDIEDVLDEDLLDNAKLVLRVRNGLPVKVELDIAMLDSNKVQIPTTIKTKYDVKVANIDDAGKVIATSIVPQDIIIEFSGAQLQALRNAHHLAYKVKVAGADGKAINFQTTDIFSIKAGVFVKAATTISLKGDNN